MRKLKLLLLLVLVILTACENKWPKDKEIEGQWQLLFIQKDNNTIDLKNEQMFWNMQLNILMLEHTDVNIYYAHFSHQNDSLKLTDICFDSNYETETDDNTRMTQEDILENLSSFGIDTVDEAFAISSLSDKTMVLKNNDKTLKFVKR